MNCKWAKVLFNEYIDGVLGNNFRGALESHLRECVRCESDFEGLLRVHAAAKLAFRFRPPEGFASRVMEKVRHEENHCQEPGFFEWFWTMPRHLKVAEVVVATIVIVTGIYFAVFLSDRLMGGNDTVTSEVTEEDRFVSAQFEHIYLVFPESIDDVYLSVMEEGNGQ